MDYERGHKRKQARALMTPEEILGMSHKQSLVMASSYGIPPFLADKSPYFAMPQYTGFYGPNPYFDRDLGSVKVPARFRAKRSLKVITEEVHRLFLISRNTKTGHGASSKATARSTENRSQPKGERHDA